MTTFDSIYAIALKLFLVSNAIGIVPAVLALVKDFPPERQRQILLRETLMALALALFFQFIGHAFLSALNVQEYALRLCGAILLILLGMSMIFPYHESHPSKALQREPFFVPIATPLLAGAGLMSIIMTFSAELHHPLMMFSAILLAWTGVTAVMLSAPFLFKLFGKRGLLALEQLMGLLLVMMSTQMLLQGIRQFLNTL